MKTILNFLFQQIVLLLIKAYDKFGKENAYKVIDDFYSKLDNKLEQRLGKDGANKVENELIDLLEEKIKSIRENLD